MAPKIVLDTRHPQEHARGVLGLVVQTWARTLNHRPTDGGDGRSRVRRYGEDTPTPEQVQAATAALEERLRKQELARKTRLARLDPVTREMLDRAFERLELADPDGHIRDAIAGFPLDAVLSGLAIFEAKRQRATLPEDAGSRYLKGIVRNIADEDEGLLFAQKLWQARRQAGDLALLCLDEALVEQQEDALDPLDLVRRLVDLTMATDRALDHAFWLRATANTITDEPSEQHQTLFMIAVRRIHGTHRVPTSSRKPSLGLSRLASVIRHACTERPSTPRSAATSLGLSPRRSASSTNATASSSSRTLRPAMATPTA